MTLTKTIIPLLIAILLVPAGIGSVSAQTVPGQEDETGNVGPVGNTEADAYLDLLKQQDFYLNMTSDQQAAYEQAIDDYRANQDAYERKIQQILDEASNLTLELQQAEEQGDLERIAQINMAKTAILETLEFYGVVTNEKLDENPSFWAQRAKAASELANNSHTTNVACGELTGDLTCGGEDAMYKMLADENIISIHTDDVSLEKQARIWYPVANIFGFVVNLSVASYSYGPGTVSTEIEDIPYADKVKFWSEICLTDDVEHNKVKYTHESTERLYTVFGNMYRDNDYGGNGEVFGTSWLPQCTNITHSTSNNALDRATLSTELGSTITVTGTHA